VCLQAGKTARGGKTTTQTEPKNSSDREKTSPKAKPAGNTRVFPQPVKSAVPNARMAALVRQCGVDFELTVGVEKALRSAGANDNLILQIGRSQGVV
jgi:hypothetical protein